MLPRTRPGRLQHNCSGSFSNFVIITVLSCANTHWKFQVLDYIPFLVTIYCTCIKTIAVLPYQVKLIKYLLANCMALATDRKEKNIHMFQQTQSSKEVGLCFLLDSFISQKQSERAQLNDFIVFIMLRRAQEWVSAPLWWYWFPNPQNKLNICKGRPILVKCCVKAD